MIYNLYIPEQEFLCPTSIIRMTGCISAQNEFHCMEFLYWVQLKLALVWAPVFSFVFVSLRQEKKFNGCEAVQNFGELSAFLV